MEEKTGEEMNDIVKHEDNGFIGMIERVAMNPDVDVEKMSKILDMQERVLDKNASVAFSKAMGICQGEMPAIARDAWNNQTNSGYAKFETIITKIKPVYTKHGFSLSFGTEKSNTDGFIKIICDVMHSEGHSKRYSVDLPVDDSGIKGTTNKTQVHGHASTYSYGQRYLVTMIFNIAIANADDDAVKAGGVTIEKFMEYNALVRKYWDEITTYKTALANADYPAAIGAWFDIPRDDQISIYSLAPSKGGVLETIERNAMKTNEWSQAIKEVFNKEELNNG